MEKLIRVLFKSLVELTGNRVTSNILVKFTQSKWSKALIPPFSKVYKIDLKEMEFPLHRYDSLHHFFTRTLKQDARIVDKSRNILVSPVDGVVSQYGSIKDVNKLNIKKKDLYILELLGSKIKADKYKEGKYVIFYLSPRNYHRIHSPVKGRIKNSWTLGGKSYPVNKFGLKYGVRPLSTNYRKITELETENKDVAIVKVGALNVNSIHPTYLKKEVERGNEIAYFSFGSTVILLVENKDLQFSEVLAVGNEIKFGEKIFYIPQGQ